MGCDIHYFAERRTKDGWELIDVEFYFGEERNYNLFGVLANVRNRCNLAPIAPRRGFPLDLSRGAIRQIFQRLEPESDGGDESDFVTFLQEDLCHHSHSWVLLEELMDYPWDQSEHTAVAGRHILQSTIPALRQFGSPRDVRVVFWFDA